MGVQGALFEVQGIGNPVPCFLILLLEPHDPERIQ